MVLDLVRAEADLAGRWPALWWLRAFAGAVGLGPATPGPLHGLWRHHVLLPSTALPRASAATELVGQVITDVVHGAGHRTIAANRGLPESTVRRWLRRLRGNAERLLESEMSRSPSADQREQASAAR